MEKVNPCSCPRCARHGRLRSCIESGCGTALSVRASWLSATVPWVTSERDEVRRFAAYRVGLLFLVARLGIGGVVLCAG